jgi:hypothetical protein
LFSACFGISLTKTGYWIIPIKLGSPVPCCLRERTIDIKEITMRRNQVSQKI